MDTHEHIRKACKEDASIKYKVTDQHIQNIERPIKAMLVP